MSTKTPSAGAMRTADVIESHVMTVVEAAEIIDREHFASPEALRLLRMAMQCEHLCERCRREIRAALAKAKGESV